MTKAEIQRIRSLQKTAGRKAENQFIAEGIKMVKEAMLNCPAQIVKVYLTHEHELEIKSSFTSDRVSNADMNRMSALKTPPGILAVISKFTPTAIPLTRPILYLDNLRDPGNVGTIIRSADWFGMGGIQLSEGCVDIYNPKVVQASMGSIFRVPLSEGVSIEKGERPIVVLDLNGESAYKSKLPAHGVYVIGSESHGPSSNISADLKVTIPPHPKSSAESLNAGVSASIICGILASKF